jgi:hypothetical protein
MSFITTRTTMPIVAKKSLDGDTNVDARIENTNDRGAPCFVPSDSGERLRAKGGRIHHKSIQTREEWGVEEEAKGGISEYVMLQIRNFFWI